MQDNVVQTQAQPFFKLAQANMDLFTRFSNSRDMTEQATANAAFVHLMQGMLKNYTEFLAEFSQSQMAIMSQGQAALLRQTQEAADGVVDVTDVRSRRARQAA